MADERTPVANITPFGLRMQPGLKNQIEEAAKANNRSMNAEIVARLEGYENLIRELEKREEQLFHDRVELLRLRPQIEQLELKLADLEAVNARLLDAQSELTMDGFQALLKQFEATVHALTDLYFSERDFRKGIAKPDTSSEAGDKQTLSVLEWNLIRGADDMLQGRIGEALERGEFAKALAIAEQDFQGRNEPANTDGTLSRLPNKKPAG